MECNERQYRKPRNCGSVRWTPNPGLLLNNGQPGAHLDRNIISTNLPSCGVLCDAHTGQLLVREGASSAAETQQPHAASGPACTTVTSTMPATCDAAANNAFAIVASGTQAITHAPAPSNTFCIPGPTPTPLTHPVPSSGHGIRRLLAGSTLFSPTATYFTPCPLYPTSPAPLPAAGAAVSISDTSMNPTQARPQSRGYRPDELQEGPKGDAGGNGGGCAFHGGECNEFAPPDGSGFPVLGCPPASGLNEASAAAAPTAALFRRPAAQWQQGAAATAVAAASGEAAASFVSANAAVSPYGVSAATTGGTYNGVGTSNGTGNLTSTAAASRGAGPGTSVELCVVGPDLQNWASVGRSLAGPAPNRTPLSAPGPYPWPFTFELPTLKPDFVCPPGGAGARAVAGTVTAPTAASLFANNLSSGLEGRQEMARPGGAPAQWTRTPVQQDQPQQQQQQPEQSLKSTQMVCDTVVHRRSCAAAPPNCKTPSSADNCGSPLLAFGSVAGTQSGVGRDADVGFVASGYLTGCAPAQTPATAVTLGQSQWMAGSAQTAQGLSWSWQQQSQQQQSQQQQQQDGQQQGGQQQQQVLPQQPRQMYSQQQQLLLQSQMSAEHLSKVKHAQQQMYEQVGGAILHQQQQREQSPLQLPQRQQPERGQNQNGHVPKHQSQEQQNQEQQQQGQNLQQRPRDEPPPYTNLQQQQQQWEHQRQLVFQPQRSGGSEGVYAAGTSSWPPRPPRPSESCLGHWQQLEARRAGGGEGGGCIIGNGEVSHHLTSSGAGVGMMECTDACDEPLPVRRFEARCLEESRQRSASRDGTPATTTTVTMMRGQSGGGVGDPRVILATCQTSDLSRKGRPTPVDLAPYILPMNAAAQQHAYAEGQDPTMYSAAVSAWPELYPSSSNCTDQYQRHLPEGQPQAQHQHFQDQQLLQHQSLLYQKQQQLLQEQQKLRQYVEQQQQQLLQEQQQFGGGISSCLAVCPDGEFLPHRLNSVVNCVNSSLPPDARSASGGNSASKLLLVGGSGGGRGSEARCAGTISCPTHAVIPIQPVVEANAYGTSLDILRSVQLLDAAGAGNDGESDGGGGLGVPGGAFDVTNSSEGSGSGSGGSSCTAQGIPAVAMLPCGITASDGGAQLLCRAAGSSPAELHPSSPEEALGFQSPPQQLQPVHTWPQQQQQRQRLSQTYQWAGGSVGAQKQQEHSQVELFSLEQQQQDMQIEQMQQMQARLQGHGEQMQQHQIQPQQQQPQQLWQQHQMLTQQMQWRRQQMQQYKRQQQQQQQQNIGYTLDSPHDYVHHVPTVCHYPPLNRHLYPPYPQSAQLSSQQLPSYQAPPVSQPQTYSSQQKMSILSEQLTQPYQHLQHQQHEEHVRQVDIRQVDALKRRVEVAPGATEESSFDVARDWKRRQVYLEQQQLSLRPLPQHLQQSQPPLLQQQRPVQLHPDQQQQGQKICQHLPLGYQQQFEKRQLPSGY